MYIVFLIPEEIFRFNLLFWKLLHLLLSFISKNDHFWMYFFHPYISMYKNVIKKLVKPIWTLHKQNKALIRAILNVASL